MVRRGPSRSDRYEHQQRNVTWQQPPPRVGKARSTTARARCPPPPASRAASPRHLASLTARAPTPKSCSARRTRAARSEEHTSELQSLMRISYAVFCLKKKNTNDKNVRNKSTKTAYMTTLE